MICKKTKKRKTVDEDDLENVVRQLYPPSFDIAAQIASKKLRIKELFATIVQEQALLEVHEQQLYSQSVPLHETVNELHETAKLYSMLKLPVKLSKCYSKNTTCKVISVGKIDHIAIFDVNVKLDSNNEQRFVKLLRCSKQPNKCQDGSFVFSIGELQKNRHFLCFRYRNVFLHFNKRFIKMYDMLNHTFDNSLMSIILQYIS